MWLPLSPLASYSWDVQEDLENVSCVLIMIQTVGLTNYYLDSTKRRICDKQPTHVPRFFILGLAPWFERNFRHSLEVRL